MLQAETVVYRYQRHMPLLEGINLTIRPGEIVGLPGASGCGKSTLGRLLAGYLSPQTGAVTYGNRLLPEKGYCPVQMIFQHPESSMNPRWKIKKILAEGNQENADLLQQFGIHSSWLDRFPHELSGGELQRIALIRVMNSDTRYLIADEMIASLDPQHPGPDLAERRSLGQSKPGWSAGHKPQPKTSGPNIRPPRPHIHGSQKMIGPLFRYTGYRFNQGSGIHQTTVIRIVFRIIFLKISYFQGHIT